MPSWGSDTVHRDHGVGTGVPAGFSLQRALMEHSGLCTSAHALSGVFQLPLVEWELHNTHKNKLQSGIKYSLPPAPTAT